LKILKILKSIIFWIVSVIGMLIFTIAFMALLSTVQEKLFLPKEYIMWIFKSPAYNLVFIYEFYIIFGFVFIFNKDSRELITEIFKSKEKAIINRKMIFLYTFIIFNIVLMYTVLFDVAVITNNKIIDYTFFSPRGNQYRYNDIVKIETGVYGKKGYLPFTHSKGDFYYIVELNDGTKIDLNEMGGSKDNTDLGDPRFIIEKLDIQYVKLGISKVSSMDNFEYCTKNLDKIYTDKIRNILLLRPRRLLHKL